MSDAQKLIRDTLRLNYHTPCDCGTCVAVWAETVAAEIDKALGGLTREEQWTPVAEDGDRWKPRTREQAERDLLSETRENLDAHGLTDFAVVVAIEGETRWVSGWTVTE